MTETPKRGLHIVPKGDAIRERQRDFGYFVLLTNGIKNPVEAIKPVAYTHLDVYKRQTS